jgi:hypothetical protein
MEWSKTRPRPTIDLAGSNLLACSLDDLPGAREAVDIAGESPDGYPPLLEAIARHAGVEPGRVASAPGCSGANFLACAALLSAGDEVLVETPNYDPLPGAARLLGARVATFPRRFEDGYALDPGAIASALTARTRLVVLSNPHNPSGVLASQGSLRELGRLAETRGFHILVDEVYLDVVLEGRPDTAALLSERFVTTSSLTKAYGLASLRCGWAIASEDTEKRIRRTRDVVDVWSPMPADRLSTIAFRHLPALAARARRIVEENSRAFAEFLSDAPKLECAPTRATLAFPRLSGVADAGPFVDRVFFETGTAVAPGRFFGAPAHFRIAFGGEPSRVRDGLETIRRCLGSA